MQAVRERRCLKGLVRTLRVRTLRSMKVAAEAASSCAGLLASVDLRDCDDSNTRLCCCQSGCDSHLITSSIAIWRVHCVLAGMMQRDIALVDELPTASRRVTTHSMADAPQLSPASSSASPSAVSASAIHASRPAVDAAARELLLTGTATAAVVGAVAGTFHSIVSGYPLPRSVWRMSSSASIVAFAYLGSSMLLAERVGLPSSSLSNQVLAGSLTFASFLSLQAAGEGRILNSSDARRMGVRGAAIGAALGCSAWGVRRAYGWWLSPAAVSGAEVEKQSGSGSWLPAWSPVRVATEEDLARAEKQKVEREKRAEQLQLEHWQRAQQQRQQQQQQSRDLE